MKQEKHDNGTTTNGQTIVEARIEADALKRIERKMERLDSFLGDLEAEIATGQTLANTHYARIYARVVRLRAELSEPEI